MASLSRRCSLRGLWRCHGALATLLLALTWLLSGIAIDRPDDAAQLGVELAQELLVLFPMLAALQAAGTAAGERKDGTLDTLRSQGLTTGAILDGWARRAWLPAAQGALLTSSTMLALTAWFRDVAIIRHCMGLPSWEPLALAVAASLAGCFAAAYGGIAVGARIGSVGLAQAFSLGLFMLLAWLPALGWQSVVQLVGLGGFGYAVAFPVLDR